MASRYYAQQSLIEIFCRIIHKGLGVPMTDLYKPEVQKEYLDKYTSREESSKFSKEHFVGKISPKVGYKSVMPNLLYELQRAINNGGILGLGPSTRRNIHQFLGVKGLKVEYLKELPFNPTTKDSFIVGTAWVEYYKDIMTQDDGITVWGVSQSILYFLPFGKARLEAHNADTGDDQTFFGTYKLFGSNNKENLTVNLKLEGAEHKELTFHFNVGEKANFDLAVGIWTNNMGKNLGGGITVIALCPLDKEGKPVDKILKPGFFRFDSMGIPESYSEFFKTAKSSYTRIPKSIQNLKNFNKFLVDLKKLLE